MYLKRISFNEYSNSRAKVIVEHSPNDRSFAFLENVYANYKLAWISEMTEPEILEYHDNIVLLGIDQDVIVFDLKNEVAVRRIHFTFNFIKFEIVDNLLYAIGELEITKLSLDNWSVLGEYNLPDTFLELLNEEGKIRVKCWDGAIYDLEKTQNLQKP